MKQNLHEKGTDPYQRGLSCKGTQFYNCKTLCYCNTIGCLFIQSSSIEYLRFCAYIYANRKNSVISGAYSGQKAEFFCTSLYKTCITSTEFSRISLDQVHRQNNTYIKGIAGATHLVSRTDEAELIRRELSSNGLAMTIQEFENELYDGDDNDEKDFNATRKHHEDS